MVLQWVHVRRWVAESGSSVGVGRGVGFAFGVGFGMVEGGVAMVSLEDEEDDGMRSAGDAVSSGTLVLGTDDEDGEAVMVVGHTSGVVDLGISVANWGTGTGRAARTTGGYGTLVALRP